MTVWLLWAIHGEPELAGITSSEENAVVLEQELGGDTFIQEVDVDLGVSQLHCGLKFWHIHFWCNRPSDKRFYAVRESQSFLEQDSVHSLPFLEDDSTRHFYAWAPTKELAFQEAARRFRLVGGDPEKYQL